MDSEVLVVASVMAAVSIVVVSFFYFRARSRRELHLTLRSAIEKGDALTPETIENMTVTKNADLRRGLLALAIGVAAALFGVIIGEDDAVRPMLGIGLFPTLIGFAYIFLWTRSNRA